MCEGELIILIKRVIQAVWCFVRVFCAGWHVKTLKIPFVGVYLAQSNVLDRSEDREKLTCRMVRLQ